jgi:Membrane protease subunits, stomatin/prohibitin homologs
MREFLNDIRSIELGDKGTKWARRAAWSLPALYFVFFIMGFPFVNVSNGHTGIDLFFGKPIATRAAGWTPKMPFIKVVEIDNQARTTARDKVESPTHDLQVANIDLNSQWSILPAGSLDLYTYFGDEAAIEKALIEPGLYEVQKSISAKYDAYDLQQKAALIADESRTAMTEWLRRSLELRKLPNQLDVATVLFPHVEFSPEFSAATSEQTTTEQSVGTYENQRTQEVTNAEAAKAAKIRSASAEAHRIRAAADSETSGIIAKAKALRQNPKLLCYMVHKGWDGKMPEISNGSSPLPFADVCKGQQ